MIKVTCRPWDKISSDLRPLLLSSAIRLHTNVDERSRDSSIGERHPVDSKVKSRCSFSPRWSGGGSLMEEPVRARTTTPPPLGTANLLKPSSSSSLRFRNIGNCMRHASHGVYQDVRNRPLRINKPGRERQTFRGTFNLRQDRGWVNDGLKTMKRRLEDYDDEGSLVPAVTREDRWAVNGQEKKSWGQRETSTEQLAPKYFRYCREMMVLYFSFSRCSLLERWNKTLTQRRKVVKATCIDPFPKSRLNCFLIFWQLQSLTKI